MRALLKPQNPKKYSLLYLTRFEMGVKKNVYEKRKVEGKSKLLSTLRFP